MSPLYLTIGLFVVAFVLVFGLCELVMRRRRARRDDDPTLT